jgi:hypothetical protein
MINLLNIEQNLILYSISHFSYRKNFFKKYFLKNHLKFWNSQLKDGLIEAEALNGLGCVAQEMHDCERALKYHSSALAIAQG